MKSIPLLVVLVCLCVSGTLIAQLPVKLSHYLFDQFEPGRVLQRNGSITETHLNYNVLSNEMIFESSPGKYLALAIPESIDSIYVLDRKFVFANGKFYELLFKATNSLFAEYSCTIKEPGADIGYGMSSVTTASPAVKSLIQSGGAYNLKLPDGFEVATTESFWVFADNRFQKAGSAKQLAAALPNKKEVINNLVKKNHTSFTKQSDMLELFRQL